MTKTERKLGRDLVEGDMVVGADRKYQVRQGDFCLYLYTPQIEQPCVIGDLAYDVEVKPRSRRERIAAALYSEEANAWFKLSDREKDDLADAIEAELDAKV